MVREAARDPSRVPALAGSLTALRLQHTPTPTAPAFLSRLAGRASARVNAPVSGAVLNEGMGRLLALLDVLENYPGRSVAPVSPLAEEAAIPAAAAMHTMHTMAAMDGQYTVNTVPVDEADGADHATLADDAVAVTPQLAAAWE